MASSARNSLSGVDVGNVNLAQGNGIENPYADTLRRKQEQRGEGGNLVCKLL